MMIDEAYKDSASKEAKKKYNHDLKVCSKNLHQIEIYIYDLPVDLL